MRADGDAEASAVRSPERDVRWSRLLRSSQGVPETLRARCSTACESLRAWAVSGIPTVAVVLTISPVSRIGAATWRRRAAGGPRYFVVGMASVVPRCAAAAVAPVHQAPSPAVGGPCALLLV